MPQAIIVRTGAEAQPGPQPEPQTAQSPETSAKQDRSEIRVNEQRDAGQQFRQAMADPQSWAGALSNIKRAAAQNIKSAQWPNDLKLPQWPAALRSAKMPRPVLAGGVAP